MHEDLLAQARQLVELDPSRPRQANLRRAVSGAYYAMFHALVDQACRMALGARREDSPYRYVMGRAFSHGTMKLACASFAGGTLRASVAKGLPESFSIPSEVKAVADIFVRMKEQRHVADYDRTETFRRSNVLSAIGSVETALAAFAGLPSSIEKRFFLSCLLTWNTLTQR